MKDVLILTTLKSGMPMIFFLDKVISIHESILDTKNIVMVATSDSDVIFCYGSMYDVLEQMGLENKFSLLVYKEPFVDSNEEKSEEDKLDEEANSIPRRSFVSGDMEIGL